MPFNVEIFATGKWHGRVFETSDLESIATAFNDLFDIHKVPLKLGHNTEQALKDGELALGWVSKVWVQGSKLMAEFSNVPTVVKEAIKNKLFRKVSVEMIPNVTVKGEHFKNILTAVSLLGAEMPAVNTLADLDKFLASSQLSGTVLTYDTIIGNRKEDNKMDEIEKLKLKLAEAEADKAKFAASLAAKDVEIDKFGKAEAERKVAEAKAKVDTARSAVTKVLEDAVIAKKILPAQREAFSNMLRISDDVAVVAIDLKEVEKLISFSNNNTGQSDSASADGTDESSSVSADVELDNKIQKYMVDSGEKDYFTACQRVMLANPELAKKFSLRNGQYGAVPVQ